MNHHRQPVLRPGFVLGSLAVCLGVFLLLRNLGVVLFDNHDLLSVLLIALGLAKLIGSTGHAGRAWGALLVLAGGYWMGSNRGLFGHYRFWDMWPVFLILIGLYFLWHAFSRPGETSQQSSSATINETAIFGGGKRVVTSSGFRGGELVALCGGHEIDLTGAEIEGEVAVIEATAVFGGVDLHVPEHWDVSVEGVAIFGGYEDKTSHPRGGEPAKRLIVRGAAVFGGVEVKN